MNDFESKVRERLLNTFIYDLIFPNPVISESNKEFCDIIIEYFNDYVVIQCKECNLKDSERLTKNTIVDGLDQLRASYNRAKNKQVEIRMNNEIRGDCNCNFKDLKKIYPILIVNERVPFLEYNKIKELYPQLNKLNFVPVIISFEDLCFLMDELDTPSDLFNYLEKREEVIDSGRIWFENEKELLSYYYLNNKSFENSENPKLIILNELSQALNEGKLADLLKKKKEEDRISYWVDDLMRRMFLSGEEKYLKVVEEFIKLNRLERRMLAKDIRLKSKQSFKEFRDAWRLFKVPESDVSFVIFFTRKSIKNRNQRLMTLVATAHHYTKSKKTIGFAHQPFETITDPISFDSICYMEGDDYLKYLPEDHMRKAILELWGPPKIENFKEFPKGSS